MGLSILHGPQVLDMNITSVGSLLVLQSQNGNAQHLDPTQQLRAGSTASILWLLGHAFVPLQILESLLALEVERCQARRAGSRGGSGASRGGGRGCRAADSSKAQSHIVKPT